MRDVCISRQHEFDIIVKAAAVGDFSVLQTADEKIKRKIQCR